jgi:glyoxylase-like metal-dependent hydrolase (beta-lactamase superfamily II)
MTQVSPRKTGPGEFLNRSPVAELPDVHQIVLPTPWEGIRAQVYLVDAGPLTLIDTGVRWPPSRAALQEAFDALGKTPSEVKRVIITHFHTDHMGQTQSLRDEGADLEVYAHEQEVALIESQRLRRERMLEKRVDLFLEHGVPAEVMERYATAERHYFAHGPVLSEQTRVDRPCRDGDRIGFEGFELRVIHAPGHTAGHMVLFEEQSGVLFTGDHVMGADVPFTDAYYLSDEPDPDDPAGRRPRLRGLLGYLDSLRDLKELNPRLILPAHGGFVTNPARTMEAARRFYESRVRRVMRVLDELTGERGEATAWEIWRAMYPRAQPEGELRRRMLLVIGALDILEEDGDCQTARRGDGVLVHRATEPTDPLG